MRTKRFLQASIYVSVYTCLTIAAIAVLAWSIRNPDVSGNIVGTCNFTAQVLFPKLEQKAGQNYSALIISDMSHFCIKWYRLLQFVQVWIAQYLSFYKTLIRSYIKVAYRAIKSIDKRNSRSVIKSMASLSYQPFKKHFYYVSKKLNDWFALNFTIPFYQCYQKYSWMSCQGPYKGTND